MQEEKRLWKSLLIFRIKLEIWLAIILAIGIAGFLLIRFYGHVDKIDQTLSASVITADKEVLSADIRMEGELTVHPFGNGMDIFSSDKGRGQGIFINGKPVIYDIHFEKETGDYLYRSQNDQPSYRAEYVVKRECEEFVFCMDVRLIFPERESEKCLIIAPAQNLEEARMILEAIPKEGLSEAFGELVKQILGT